MCAAHWPRVAFDGDVGAFSTKCFRALEHHLVMAYGEIMPELEMLARTLHIQLTLMK